MKMSVLKPTSSIEVCDNQLVLEQVFYRIYQSRIWTLKKMRLEGLRRRDQTRPKGGMLCMSEIFYSEVQGLRALLSNGLRLRQIYEICVPTGDYKEHLLQTIPHGYDQYRLISGAEFNSLEELVTSLQTMRLPYSLLLLDISELLYLDALKDAVTLKTWLKRLYATLRTLIKLGTTCVLFTNYIYHDLLAQGIDRADVIQIHIGPSKVHPYYWEARIIDPQEPTRRCSLFRPFIDDIPYLFH